MASAAQRRIKSISYAKYGYLFILPFFLVYGFFQFWPLIKTFILSLYGNGDAFYINAMGKKIVNETSNEVFVGLDNFKALLFGGKDELDSASIQQEYFFKPDAENDRIIIRKSRTVIRVSVKIMPPKKFY